MMRTIALALSIVASLIVVSACNTFEGIGKDIEKGGRAIEKAAR